MAAFVIAYLIHSHSRPPKMEKDRDLLELWDLSHIATHNSHLEIESFSLRQKGSNLDLPYSSALLIHQQYKLKLTITVRPHQRTFLYKPILPNDSRTSAVHYLLLLPLHLLFVLGPTSFTTTTAPSPQGLAENGDHAAQSISGPVVSIFCHPLVLSSSLHTFMVTLIG